MSEPDCPGPDWMLDCLHCQAQDWEVGDRSQQQLRLRCRACDATETYALTASQDGATCVSCRQKTWTIVCDNRAAHHHVKLQCDECGDVASAWLQHRE